MDKPKQQCAWCLEPILKPHIECTKLLNRQDLHNWDVLFWQRHKDSGRSKE